MADRSDNSFSRRSRLRYALFKRGADALERLFPDVVARYGRNYICRLCDPPKGYPLSALSVQSETGEPILTLEDVPPKSMGGRPLLLTCKDCNSTAGHELDHHMYRRDLLRDFFARKTREAIRIAFGPKGLALQSLLEMTDKGWAIKGKPKLNDPRRVVQVKELLSKLDEEDSWEQQPFELEMRAFDQRRAQIAELRVAYLAAFATFGYSYILHTRLERVRRQIRNPHEFTIKHFSSVIESKLPGARFGVLIARSPVSSIVVRLGQRIIFLPGLEAVPHDPYETITRQVGSGELSQELRAIPLGWPTGLDLVLDFNRGESDP